jgi:CheY-like chemotaxis protein
MSASASKLSRIALGLAGAACLASLAVSNVALKAEPTAATAPSAQIVLTTSIDPVRCGVLINCDGLAGFLTKPVDPQDLRRVLARITVEEPSSGIHVATIPP